MLLLLICALGQFQPATAKPPTLEEFVKSQVARQKADIASAIAETELSIRNNRGKGRVLATLKKKLATLKQTQAKPPLPPPTSRMEFQIPGSTGHLGDKVTPTCIVVQILSKNEMLCETEARSGVFVVRGLDTKDKVDGSSFPMHGLWTVAGTYSYTSTEDARKKVMVLTPWPHQKQYEALTREDVAKMVNANPDKSGKTAEESKSKP